MKFFFKPCEKVLVDLLLIFVVNNYYYVQFYKNLVQTNLMKKLCGVWFLVNLVVMPHHTALKRISRVVYQRADLFSVLFAVKLNKGELTRLVWWDFVDIKIMYLVISIYQFVKKIKYIDRSCMTIKRLK